MSQDCFSEPETDSVRLSAKGQAKPQAAIPEKPDMEVLVKEAVNAYGTHPAALDIYSAPASGDPVLFKIAARSLQQPIWAFFSSATLAAMPGLLVVLVSSLIVRKGFVPADLAHFVAPLIVMAALLLLFVAIVSRGNSLVSYSLGALAGGILIASVLAVHIIKQDNHVAMAPAETQEQLRELSARSPELVESTAASANRNDEWPAKAISSAPNAIPGLAPVNQVVTRNSNASARSGGSQTVR